MAWVKVKWINPLFSAFEEVAPNRQVVDGTIGDKAHQGSTPGHNPDDTPGSKSERTDADTKAEVRAADVDADLNAPFTMMQVIEKILATPRDRDRFIYIIFAGFVWRKRDGWRRAVYTGKNKHYDHAHFSGDPDHDENGAPFLSILSFKNYSTGGANAVADSEFHTGAVSGPFLTQGNKGYVGQQRDTALAFAWQAADAAAASAAAAVSEVKALRTELKALAELVKSQVESKGSADVVGTVYVDVKVCEQHSDTTAPTQ